MARLRCIHKFIQYFQLFIRNSNLVAASLLNRVRNAPPSKPTNRREITYLIGMAEGDDRRPESSPFTGFTTQVYFNEGPQFVVPASLIEKCPKLVADGTRWPPSAIRLNDVASNIAHVLFYYLLTDTYQCLRPKGSSHHERLGDELTTGVQAYNAARNYDLPALQELAKGEIQRIAQELPFPFVLNLLRNLHLDPSERESWIDDYVQSGLKTLFQTPTAFLDLTSLQVEHGVISLSNILLKSLAGLLSNDGALTRKDVATTPTPPPEPAAIEEVPVVVDDLIYGEESLVVPAEEPIYAEESQAVPTEERIYAGESQAVSMEQPLELEREALPVASGEPTDKFDPEEYLRPVSGDVYDEPAREIEIPIPEVEPEVKPDLVSDAVLVAGSDSPADSAFSPRTWSGFTSKSKKESLWLEDEIVSSTPGLVSEPLELPTQDALPSVEPESEPAPVPDSWDVQRLEPEPVAEPAPAPEPARVETPPADDESTTAAVAPTVAPKKSKKKKKGISIFRAAGAEESPEPEPKPSVEEVVPAPAAIAKPEPEPQPQPEPVPAPAPVVPEAVTPEAVASPASSSAPPKKKKKKKSIFWTESA
ncbi:hypothetical protein F5X98DRAFT_162158 [Xylaria grammica]|nr:hypothetical protein F5X98DRAFT_162158 [Xylaria grammica]